MKEKILILGGALVDCYYWVDRYPERSQDGYILEQFDVVGGCSINAAYTIMQLGGKPYVVSAVGNDEKGDKIFSYFRKHGLSDRYLKEVKEQSGYCLVFIEPDGERTFLTSKGCEGTFSPGLLDESAMTETAVAVVTGYYLLEEDSIGVIMALQEMKRNGCKVLFDPSPLVDKIPDEVLTGILELCDVITPNYHEGEIIRLFQKMNSLDEWTQKLVAEKKIVILKDGKNGGMVYDVSRKFSYEAKSVDVIDTTGAGDSFAGAIAYGISKEMELEKIIELAAACAAEITKIKGPHGEFSVKI